MFKRLAASILMAVALFPGRVCGQDAELWRLVARSDVVAVGTFDLPETDAGAQTYVRIPIVTTDVLLGPIGWPLMNIRWYSGPSAYSPTAQQLAELSGRPVLAFLVRADGELYFTEAMSGAALASPDAVNAARAEIARQAEVLSNWRPGSGTPHDGEVRRIIDRIAALKPSQDREQQRLFQRLEALGPSAVPAIIMQMDDDRPLPTPTLSLVNHSPDAFEGIRHYGPDVLSEALAAILNQLTGESFGNIYNGATRAERRRAIDGWRIYLDHLTNSVAR